tara:strand:+ start:2352 stop:2912 length:561 start_codon:yes stop_codon:yes gene_type:complete
LNTDLRRANSQNFPVELTISSGTAEDVDQILKLQKYWLQKTRACKQGFLFGCPFSQKQLLSIVRKAEISVAWVNQNFAGFFLLDSLAENVLTQDYKERLQKYRHHFTGTVCPRAQIAVHPKYLGMGISKRLTQSSTATFKKSYDAVFSIVSKQNNNMSKHLHNGWEIIDEDDEMYYVKLDLNKKNT